MASLSEDDLLAMQRQFGGRITQSHEAYDEFTGVPPVLIPADSHDVAIAITLARASGREVHIRSGRRVQSDRSVPNSNIALVSLERFNSIQIDLHHIKVGAAATVGDLATALRYRALFVPLPDDPTLSLASAVLGVHRDPFPHSAKNAPKLADAVEEAEIVRTGDFHEGEAETLKGEAWQRFRETPNGVVLRLVIDASKWFPFGQNRWLRAWMVPYHTKERFGVLCDELFGREELKDVDYSVRASRDAHGGRVMVVRASGQDRQLSETARLVVEKAFEAGEYTVLLSDKVDGAGASISAWVGTGPALATGGEVQQRLASTHPWGGQAQEAAFLDQVDELLAQGAWVELHAGSLIRRALFDPSVLLNPGGPLIAPAPRPRPLAPLQPFEKIFGSLLRPTHEGVVIPGFDGEVLVSGERSYQQAAEQYASLFGSYDAATIARRMTPSLVAVPKNNPAAVLTAVAWAARKGLKVVARSGGHQYCGLSSGGAGTVLIDLKNLETIKFQGDTVSVGPGVALEDLTKVLVANHVSIPHGECPLVNLGGHVQTGGVGHQLRGLGLCLDYVVQFKMVVQLGGQWQVATFDKPTSPVNDGVFAAVLGGGPGSFGVLTEITFEVVPDSRYPHSAAYTRAYPYNRGGWAAALDQLRHWSVLEHNGDLPPGLDLFITVLSGNRELWPNINYRPDVLVVETSALEGNKEMIKDVVEAVQQEVSWFDAGSNLVIDLIRGDVGGEEAVSVIVDHGVRSRGALGGMPGGREFDLAYKKSLYVTRRPLPDDFCLGLVDLVDRVNRDPDMKVVFQAVVGGGKFAQRNSHTRMQHRDAVVQIVFDVFYSAGRADRAVAYQNEMKQLWEKHLPGETDRLFWGTYEDAGSGGVQLDMNNLNTQSYYYDSPETYRDLQDVKKLVDPENVFHTTFTVQPRSAD